MKRILLSLLALVAIGTGARAQDMTSTPLTLEATTEGDITFSVTYQYDHPVVLTPIEYKINDGSWTTYSWPTDEAAIKSGGDWPHTFGNAIHVLVGDKVAFRGNNAFYYGNGKGFESHIASTADVYVYGNFMSLIHAADFATNYAMTGDWNFAKLFRKEGAQPWDPPMTVTTIKSHPTNDIVLPATSLTNNCYTGLFAGCKGITRAPELPSTTMTVGCYQEMFRGTGLTAAPELPATVFTPFSFDGDGEHGSIDCYMQMFQDCTSLTTAPAILPATKLTHGVYQNMFEGCTSLTTAPVLPATKLADQAYCNMFNGCTSLNYVKCFATDISETWAVEDWMKGVPAGGTFVKSAAMTSWPTGDSGIPAGWTVQNTTAADGDMNITPLTLEAVAAGTITIKNTNGLTLDYTSSISGAHSSSANPVTITVAAGETIALQCNNTTNGMNFGISSDADIYVYGNPLSMVFGSGFVGQTDLSACDYGILMGLFHPALDGATLYPHTLSHPSKDIVLLATTLSIGCYGWMFSGCTNLTSAPVLPARTLANDCYHRMFEHCTSLTTAPDLPASTLIGQCYGGMFDGCTSLNYVKCLATTFDDKGMNLGDWLNDVAATGTFVKAEIADYPLGISGIPTGWTIQTQSGVGASETLTANDDGEGNYWTTYYNGLVSVTADANTTVYKARVSGDKVVLTDVGNKDIPAGNAVVMKSSASSVTLSVGYSSGTLSDNDLVGQSAPFNTPDNLYALVKGASGVGFYNYPYPSNFPAQKAYLVIAGGGGVKAFYPLSGDEGTTAIEMAETADEAHDAALYDLSGRRLQGNPRSGIYVKNGKKVIIK